MELPEHRRQVRTHGAFGAQFRVRQPMAGLRPEVSEADALGYRNDSTSAVHVRAREPGSPKLQMWSYAMRSSSCSAA